MKTSLFFIILVAFGAQAQLTNSTEIYIGKDAVVSAQTEVINTKTGKMANHGQLELKKDLHNDGVFKSDGKVHLIGTEKQNLGGQNTLELAELRVANPQGVSQDVNIQINESLVLDNGVVENLGKELVIKETAQVKGASDASHIVGEITSEKAANFEYPVGNGTELKSISLTQTKHQAVSYTDATKGTVSALKNEEVEEVNSAYWTIKSKKDNVQFVNITKTAKDENIVLNDGTEWKALETKNTGESLGSELSAKAGSMYVTTGKTKKAVATVGIFPNPTSGDFHLLFTNFTDTEQVKVKVTLNNGVEIMTMQGRVADLKKSYQLPDQLNSQNLLLRVERLAKKQNFVERIVFDK